MKPFSDFVPYIGVDIDRAGDPVIEHACRNAAIEFFTKARVWIVDIAPVDVVAATAGYALISPVAETTPVLPLELFHGVTKLVPKTREELAREYGNWKDVDGMPRFFCADRPRQFILVPNPTDALLAGITGQIAITPTRSAEGVDDEMFEDHVESIVLGAKARLFRMKNRSWSDRNLANDNLALFNEEIAKARLRAAKAFSRARIRSPAHFF